jgi:hypothetical protein
MAVSVELRAFDKHPALIAEIACAEVIGALCKDRGKQ